MLGQSNIKQNNPHYNQDRRQVKTNDNNFPMVLMKDPERKPDLPEVEIVEPPEGVDVFGVIPIGRIKRNFRQYE